MPDWEVGYCRIAADGAGRVYVIWRTGFGPKVLAYHEPHDAGDRNNLVYRVLEGGALECKAYVDARGQAHFVALVHSSGISPEPTKRFQVIENGRQKPGVALPGDYWRLLAVPAHPFTGF